MIYRLSVRTLTVIYFAMKHARRVSRAVPGLANTRGLVVSHAQHRVPAFHAIGAALKSSPVITNVPAYVEKYVLKAIAKHVPPRMTLE